MSRPTKVTNIFRKTVVVATAAIAFSAPVSASDAFNRVASFPVYLNTDIESETVSEIVSATADGNTLVYTDGEVGGIGFVDITDIRSPKPAGFAELDGEPTSVAVVGDYALVGVNTSDSFVAPSGFLAVVDVASRAIVATIALAGQPDAIAVSDDGNFAAVVIENERDEDLTVDGVEGGLPQLPAGLLQVVTLAGEPGNWSVADVDLTGLAALGGSDPEPEFVDINGANIAAVSMQENNHIVLVDLASASVVGDFPAGTVDLDAIDTEEEDLISLTSSLKDVPREPDALAWVTDRAIATANEGDFLGGSRGFSIFNQQGDVLFDSGNSLDQLAVRLGHYPDDRSGNKGNEPESVTFAKFGDAAYLFVGSERSSIVFVYRVFPNGLRYVQTLPAGVGPEGLLAIPHRNLFVVASEVDSRDDKIRASISLYELGESASYPTIVSADRADGTPIPWGALSALAADPRDSRTLYSVYDSAYQKSRIFELRLGAGPATVVGEIELTDALGVLAGVQSDRVNDDLSVNIDPEGIAVSVDGGFWVASEGDTRPDIVLENLLVRTDSDGVILDAVTLPQRLRDNARRFGFEGVASVLEGGKEILYVAFQRAWEDAGDPEQYARIGRYDVASGQWSFAWYPLSEPTSANGGWVGLSEITAVGDGLFGLIERDNQAGPDAAIKLITLIDVSSVDFKADGEAVEFDVLEKTVFADLLADGTLTAPGGLVLEKIEGLALTRSGSVYIVNDNDAVDDSNGETQLLRIR